VLPSVLKSRNSNAVRFADYGLDMPSFGLFASEEKLASRKEAIGRFASVVSRTWEYIFAGHQDEATEAIIAQRPQARLDRTILRGQIDALQPYFGIGEAGARIGAPVPADWTKAVQTLSSVGLISGKLAAQDFYATGLVAPERYDTLVRN
jgi:NitT/TauT family transport system substrate-binding protein